MSWGVRLPRLGSLPTSCDATCLGVPGSLVKVASGLGKPRALLPGGCSDSGPYRHQASDVAARALRDLPVILVGVENEGGGDGHVVGDGHLGAAVTQLLHGVRRGAAPQDAVAPGRPAALLRRLQPCHYQCDGSQASLCSARPEPVKKHWRLAYAADSTRHRLSIVGLMSCTLEHMNRKRVQASAGDVRLRTGSASVAAEAAVAAAAALVSSSAPMYRVVPRLNLNVGAKDSVPSCQSLNARPANTYETTWDQDQSHSPYAF